MFATGPISISAIATYFGKSTPLSLNQMYRGYPEIYNTPQNSGIPTSGTISLSDFRNSYRYPFNITNIMSSANSLVSSTPSNIIMPPYSSSDHWANFYWTGSAWVIQSQDSYGGGDTYGNVMRGIFPAYFAFFNTITGGGIVSHGNGNNNIQVGTKYTNIEGYIVNGTSSTGYTNSDTMTFNYLNAIIHGMSGTWGNLQPILNGINFAGSRTQFIAGMQAYVNYLYAN